MVGTKHLEWQTRYPRLTDSKRCYCSEASHYDSSHRMSDDFVDAEEMGALRHGLFQHRRRRKEHIT